MQERIAAIVFNTRETLKKVEELQNNLREMDFEKDDDSLREIIQKLREASSVLLIFNDFVGEIEEKVEKLEVRSHESKIRNG